MANLKNITELPVAESAEGLNLIVNDNGAAKQIAASAVGAQADWNVTDESHPAFIKNKPVQVQADWAETDETSAAFVKNKPVIPEGFSGYDLVIDHSNYGNDGPVLTHGSYAVACEKMRANIPPMVCIFGFRYTGDGKNSFSEYKNIQGISINNDNRIYIDIGDMNYYALSADNTVEYIQE